MTAIYATEPRFELPDYVSPSADDSGIYEFTEPTTSDEMLIGVTEEEDSIVSAVSSRGDYISFDKSVSEVVIAWTNAINADSTESHPSGTQIRGETYGNVTKSGPAVPRVAFVLAVPIALAFTSGIGIVVALIFLIAGIARSQSWLFNAASIGSLVLLCMLSVVSLVFIKRIRDAWSSS